MRKHTSDSTKFARMSEEEKNIRGIPVEGRDGTGRTYKPHRLNYQQSDQI